MSGPNGTHYVKFDYILLRTNDTIAHDHLANDKPEILKITTDTTFDASPLTNATNATRKHFVNEQTGQHFESKIEHTILDDQNKVAVQFDELTLVKKEEDEQIDAMLSGKHQQDAAAAVSPTSSDIDQKNDEHYGKILQWIHYNL